MAAEYMRHRAARERLFHVVVDSAGLLGIEGARASPEAIRVLGEEGVDLSSHRSRGLSETDLRSADLVLVMGPDHLEFLERRFPEIGPRRLLLRAFERSPDPERGAPALDDPIGQPIEVYRRCFESIRTSVDHLVLHLKHGT